MMPRMSCARSRVRVALSGLVLVCAVPLAACATPTNPAPTTSIVPADAPLQTVQAETIDDYRPDGVVYRGTSSTGADDVTRYNSQTWEFVAADESALVAAAAQVKGAAVAAGWTMATDFAQGATGVFTATLTKGQMALTLTYTTSASFSLTTYDTDELLLSAKITIDPSLPEAGS